MAIEKTPERATAGSNPSLAQLCDGLHQSPVRLSGNQIEYLLRKLFQWRNASSTRLRHSALAFVPALQPLYRRTHAHLETFSRLAPRRTAFNSFDYAFPQITRIGLRHRPPQRETHEFGSADHIRSEQVLIAEHMVHQRRANYSAAIVIAGAGMRPRRRMSSRHLRMNV